MPDPHPGGVAAARVLPRSADLRTTAGWIATAGGIGLAKPGPGTWASAATGIVVALVVPHLITWSWWLIPAMAVTVALVGVWAAGAAAASAGIADPGWVVIDEVAGMLVGFALVPPEVLTAAPWAATGLVFMAFRVYDIAKPWPLARLERFPGGWGIMADDLAAGAIAGVLAAALLR